METVIQALEKMGRATYREVAARLDIDPVDALTGDRCWWITASSVITSELNQSRGAHETGSST